MIFIWIDIENGTEASLVFGRCIYVDMISPLQCGDILYSSESDVCGRQILTIKVDPRTARVKVFLIAEDP